MTRPDPDCSLSDAEKCATCIGYGQVFASCDVERPELDRWYACPDCTVSFPKVRLYE